MAGLPELEGFPATTSATTRRIVASELPRLERDKSLSADNRFHLGGLGATETLADTQSRFSRRQLPASDDGATSTRTKIRTDL